MKLSTLILSSTAFLLILSGCGAKPTPKKEAKIDSSLPLVTLTKNGVFADMNAIAFEWNSLRSDLQVEGIYIYKQNLDNNASKSAYYETIDNRFVTHYLDSKITPNTRYRYYFKTFSKDAESKKSKAVVVSSLPVFESVSWIHSLQEMPRSVKIIWRPHSNQKVKSYSIERRTLENDEWGIIATVDGRLSAEYIDNELKDNHVYMYRLSCNTYDGLTSMPSAIVKAVTKALPKTITNIQASRDLPKKIKLTWDDSDAKDFGLYYVYRSDSIDGNYELIAKLYNNVHVDVIDEDQKEFFYRVSAVDKDGLESENAINTIEGTTLRRPTAPALVEARLIDNKIELIWSEGDARAKSYTVTKRFNEGWFKEKNEDFEGITSKRFTDYKIKPSTTYYYTVYAVDENSIKSDPSIEVEFKMPDSKIEIAPHKADAQKEVQTKIIDGIDETSHDVVSPMQDLDLNEI